MKAALASFEKAAKLEATSEVNNNLVMANLAAGNTAEAAKYAKAADAEAKAAVAAAQGDYKNAASNLNGYNRAIAETMNHNYAAAKKAIANDNSADADYRNEGGQPEHRRGSAEERREEGARTGSEGPEGREPARPLRQRFPSLIVAAQRFAGAEG